MLYPSGKENLALVRGLEMTIADYPYLRSYQTQKARRRLRPSCDCTELVSDFQDHTQRGGETSMLADFVLSFWFRRSGFLREVPKGFKHLNVD